MILQLHHQFKNRTEFVSQRGFKHILPFNEIKAWIKEMQEQFPVPDNAVWMVCSEESEHFIKTHAEVGEREIDKLADETYEEWVRETGGHK